MLKLVLYKMATSDDGEEISLLIRFVLPKGKTETTCTEDLGYAFDQAQDHCMAPTWIDEDDCAALNPAKTVSTIYKANCHTS